MTAVPTEPLIAGTEAANLPNCAPRGIRCTATGPEEVIIMSTMSELQDALDIVGKWPQQEATTHPRIQSSMSIVYLAAKQVASLDYEAAYARLDFVRRSAVREAIAAALHIDPPEPT